MRFKLLHLEGCSRKSKVFERTCLIVYAMYCNLIFGKLSIQICFIELTVDGDTKYTFLDVPFYPLFCCAFFFGKRTNITTKIDV